MNRDPRNPVKVEREKLKCWTGTGH